MFSRLLLFRTFSKASRIKPYLPPGNVAPGTEVVSKPALIDQHPKNLHDTDTRIISTEKKYYITKPEEVDIRFYNSPTNTGREIPKPEVQKSLRVAFVGLPNAGKSTLVNKLTGTMVSAVSKLSYTTWDNTIGVKSNVESGVQLVLVDTPGIVDKYDKNKAQVTEAWKAVDDADLVAFVVDGARRTDNSTTQVLNRLKEKLSSETYLQSKKQSLVGTGKTPLHARQPLILIVNKVDIATNRRKLVALKDELEDLIHFDKIFIVSGDTGFGLESLNDYLEGQAEEMKWEYDVDSKIEKSEAEMSEEIVREAIFHRFFNNVPFHIDIKTTRIALRSDGLLRIHVHLKVFKKSQLPMVIGKRGQNIKWLKEDLEARFAKRYGHRTTVTFTVSQSKHSEADALKYNTTLLDDPAAAFDQEKKALDVALQQYKIDKNPALSMKYSNIDQQALSKFKAEIKGLTDKATGVGDLVKGKMSNFSAKEMNPESEADQSRTDKIKASKPFKRKSKKFKVKKQEEDN